MTTATASPAKKRTREVYPTGEIAHLWAHQRQERARNPQGNFYYEGDTIYSYGSHFAIARHVVNKRGERAILFTTRTNSNTTASHISAVRGSIPPDIQVFNCPAFSPHSPGGGLDHSYVWESYLKRIKALAEKSKRATKDGDAIASYCAKLVEEANAYAKFYGLRKSVQGIEDVERLLARVDREKDKIERARLAREKQEEEERQARAAETLERWKDGEPVHVPYSVRKVFLRVIGEEIQTSKGARFPVAHGIKAFKMISECRASSRPWERNGHSIHVGTWAIDRINPDGSVDAGCHHVEWDEIERIAREVGAI